MTIQKKYFLAVLLLLAVAPALPLGILMHEFATVKKMNPNPEKMGTISILDRKGRLIAELFQEKRTFVPYAQIPGQVVRAFLVAEDRNFYLHAGIDPNGLARALYHDIRVGSFEQGGSTITQQLVKQLHTTGQRTVTRKFAELFLALDYEKHHTKDQILEAYLNHIYFGHGVHGVAEASKFFLGKELRDLDPVEASLLAVIPRAPNRYSPLKNPVECSKRHASLVMALAGSGDCGAIDCTKRFVEFWTQFRLDLAERFPTETVRTLADVSAPHVTEMIRLNLENFLGKERFNRGGFTVYTTIDLDIQQAGEKTVSRMVEEEEERTRDANRHRIAWADFQVARETKSGLNSEQAMEFGRLREALGDELDFLSLLTGADILGERVRGYLRQHAGVVENARVNGALVALDPQTGAVLALVGGREFTVYNQVNRAMNAARQPGSAFKPFVYGAALERKLMTPASNFKDQPLAFFQKTGDWEPSNYDKKYYGRVLARQALAYSLNVVPVVIHDRIGAASVADFAGRCMGLPQNRFTLDPTIVLGSSEVTPLELAQGFAVFANGGSRIIPYLVERVIDSEGKSLAVPWAGYRGRVQVLSPETAWLTRNLLESVVNSGTASGVRTKYGIHGPVFGKTGTNSKYRDAWFAGSIPGITAVVWAGCDSPVYTLGPGRGGSEVAVPAWSRFILNVRDRVVPSGFPEKPGTILQARICSKTGKLAGPSCPGMTEYFLPGTVPSLSCDGSHDELDSVFSDKEPESDPIDGIMEKILDKPEGKAPK